MEEGRRRGRGEEEEKRKSKGGLSKTSVMVRDGLRCVVWRRRATACCVDGIGAGRCVARSSATDFLRSLARKRAGGAAAENGLRSWAWLAFGRLLLSLASSPLTGCLSLCRLPTASLFLLQESSNPGQQQTNCVLFLFLILTTFQNMKLLVSVGLAAVWANNCCI